MNHLFIFLPSNLINTPIRNLDAETQRFVIQQLLIELMQRKPYSTNTRKDFIMFSRQTYRDDDVRLRQIDEYELQQFVFQSFHLVVHRKHICLSYSQ